MKTTAQGPLNPSGLKSADRETSTLEPLGGGYVWEPELEPELQSGSWVDPGSRLCWVEAGTLGNAGMSSFPSWNEQCRQVIGILDLTSSDCDSLGIVACISFRPFCDSWQNACSSGTWGPSP